MLEKSVVGKREDEPVGMGRIHIHYRNFRDDVDESVFFGTHSSRHREMG